MWLYRGQKKRFVELVNKHTDASLNAVHDCFSDTEPLDEFLRAMHAFGDKVKPFVDSLKKAKLDGTLLQEYLDANNDATSLVGNFRLMTSDAQKHRNDGADTWPAVVDFAEHLLAPLADLSRSVIGALDHQFKIAARIIDHCEAKEDASESALWNSREIKKALKAAEIARHQASEQLKRVPYFQRHAHWLICRFPDAEFVPVLGLCKTVTRADIEAADWSLTPGRYVGVAPAEVDEDFDFAQTMGDIHTELRDLNTEAAALAVKIQGPCSAASREHHGKVHLCATNYLCTWP